MGCADGSYAQLLPVNQPEQNACNALLLCGNSFTSPYAYQGVGTVTDLSSTPCGSGEGNSMWLKLVVNTAGTIVFVISPTTTTDDYDFAVLDASGGCSSLSSSNVVRCNFNNNYTGSNVNGQIGLNSTSTTNFVTSGTTGSSYCQQINAAAGDVYLIMINNFGTYSTGNTPTSGFTIDFSGSTAIFYDTVPPTFSYLTATDTCAWKDSITVYLNTQVKCTSITASGSDFQLSPSGTIASATGVSCSGTNGYTQSIKLYFASSLSPGTYTLKATTGTDTNTLLNLCDIAMPVGDSIQFTIAPKVAYETADLSCTSLTVHTVAPFLCSSLATNGSDFVISGPSTVGVSGATAVGCTAAGYSNTILVTLSAPITQSGTYVLASQTGTDGNTLLDQCADSQAVGDTIAFAATANPVLQLPDSLVTCSNTGIVLPLTITNPETGISYYYNWSPASGLDNASAAQPFANPSGDQWYTVTVTGDNSTMCSAKDSVYVHNLMGMSIITNDTTICDGSSFLVDVNGSDEYSYIWTPATGVSNASVKEPYIGPTTNTVYTLTASYPGCNDTADQITVSVEPNPTNLELTADRIAMCQYDSIVLHAVVTPYGYSFSYSWTPTGSLEYATGPNNVFFGDTSTTVKVFVTTPIGCSASDSIRLTVYPGNFGSVLANDLGVCPSDSVQLEAQGGASYLWTPGSGLSDSTIANPVAYPLVGTTYSVLITDRYGCVDTQLVTVAVYPGAVLAMPDSVVIHHGEQYHIQPQTNAHYFSWFPPSGLTADNVSDPYAYPEVRTRYFVTATTEPGCSIKDSIDILVENTMIDMPNAFAPTAGSFKPVLAGIAYLKYFNVYNRWGQKVFSTTDISKGWDGSFKGTAQPVGVYTYTIDAVTDDGRPFVKNGNVTLVR
ncbi:MAG: gliding motility-associated C-terminal domain-containing protein [Edaphocola sp.]